MKGALRLLYPPQCLCCGTGVAADGALCPACWGETRFITGLCCPRCGVPLAEDGSGAEAAPLPGPDTLLCDDCMVVARPWRHGRAALVYAGTGRSLALAFKHGDRPDLAPALAAMVARAAAPLLRPDMVAVPVPIHWRRMLTRRYNQAELLARHVARIAGIAVVPDALFRLRPTPMQDHRGVADRFANLAGAITAGRAAHAHLGGRAVLLVDDVMTSGATLAACAEALRAAGAGPVSVAVLARAVKDA